LKKIRLKEEEMTMFSMEDWEKIMIEEVKRRWENRRKELEEIEEKIEIRKKKKEERRKRAIREKRCFVCGIFGHMAHYCRNREEDKGLVQVPKNRFEVLRQSDGKRRKKWKGNSKRKKRDFEKGKDKEREEDEEGENREERENERRQRGKDRRRERGRNTRFLQRGNLKREILSSMVEGAVLQVWENRSQKK